MSKTVLVVGAGSVVAQAILPWLSDYTVVTAGRQGCDVTIDIQRRVTIPPDVNTVVNFAASLGGVTDAEIMQAVETNAVGLLRICQAAHKAEVTHIMQISTGYASLVEQDPQYSIYTLTKRQADELASFYCKRVGLPLTILRPSRVYGDTDRFAQGQPFLYRILRQVQQGNHVDIYGSNDVRRNYLHVADLAEITARVIAHCPQGIFSCSFPADVTCTEIVEAARETFQSSGSIRFIKDKPDISNDSFLLDTDLYRAIGYWPKISIQAGIERIKETEEQVA